MAYDGTQIELNRHRVDHFAVAARIEARATELATFAMLQGMEARERECHLAAGALLYYPHDPLESLSRDARDVATASALMGARHLLSVWLEAQEATQ